MSFKYKRRKYHELTASDLLGIAHAVIVQFRFRRDIAEEYRVSVDLVGRIASMCKNGTAWIEERQATEELRNSHVDTVR